MSEERVTVRVLIAGRVQGVWFRAWTVEQAMRLKLDGWVRNKRDGSVEALFSGSPDNVERMVALCWDGPPSAVVSRVEVLPSDAVPPPGFSQRPTA